MNFREKVRFDASSKANGSDIPAGQLHLPNTYKSCWIIDGQHRLYATALVRQTSRKPTLSVIGFENLPPAKEAELFATINREQKQVTRKLLDELEGELKWDSPLKKEQIAAIASRAVDILRSEVGSPFFDLIVSPGLVSDQNQPLTLPEMKKAIISSGLIGREVSRGQLFVPGVLSANTNEQCLQRLVDVLNGYFELIQSADPVRWARGRAGYVCSNFGVPAYIRLLGLIAKHVESEHAGRLYNAKPKDIIRHVQPYLTPVIDFIQQSDRGNIESKFKVRLGAGGIREYLSRLCDLISSAGIELRK